MSFITILSSLRMGFGFFSLLAPSTTLSLFQMPVHSSALVTTRLFGVRDAVLGGLLWTADSPAAVRRALIAGVIVDGIDALGAVYGLWQGDLDMLATDLVGGGAIVFLAMGLYGLRSRGLLKAAKL
jgi:hypothetical protein